MLTVAVFLFSAVLYIDENSHFNEFLAILQDFEISTDNFEKILAVVMLVFSLYFLYIGITLLLQQAYFGLVFLFFAQTTLRMVWADYQVIQQKNDNPLLWLRMHITRMTGAWIAAFTAFLVVNVDKLTALFGDGFAGQLSILVWIAPAAVGTFFIIYWLRKMKA